MIPNDFGIIRQADRNLFALLFPALSDISEFEYEIIYPEYIDGYYVTSNGSLASSSYYKYTNIDISKYDYFLAPSGNYGSTTWMRNGCRVDNASTTFYQKFDISSLPDDELDVYALIKTNVSYPIYTCAIPSKAPDIPIIGFKRHRSDHVNPLGIIQPLYPGMLCPQVEDPDIEEEALEESLDDVDPYPEDN